MSAAVSSPRLADDALLSASVSSLPVSLHEAIPAVSAGDMPESEQAHTNVEPPGDMDDRSASSRTGTPPAQPSSHSSRPSHSPSPPQEPPQDPPRQEHPVRPPQDDILMEGTAEPEDRPSSPDPDVSRPPPQQSPEHDQDAPTDDDDDEPIDDGDASESEEEDDDDYEQKVFLKTYKQDTSVPGPEELDEMNRRRTDEVSALDNDRWTAQAFTPLDDPEHTVIPGVACLSWTLDNFHGSKESPNKQRSMSSPPAILTNHDGKQYQFCIKVFPRGNDGTEYMSVYIECCPVDTSTDAASEDPQVFDRVGASWWEVTAQFGCVMYNPVEPRVHKFQKSHHQFTSINADFGWPRFAGPWGRIHIRDHLQYRPLLQDDRVAFTAFVRLVEDPTRALWYHNQYPHNPDWDSVLKTGYRGLTTTGLPPIQTSLISALVVWFEIAPFRQLISAFQINDGLSDPLGNFQPLLEALKVCLDKKQTSRKHLSPTHDVSLDQVVTVLEWYGCNQLPTVFEVWRTLQTLLEHEIALGLERNPSEKAQELSNLANAFFRTAALIQSNMEPVMPVFAEFNGESAVTDTKSDYMSPASSQELADRISDASTTESPFMIAYELPRQAYDTEKRKWKKLVHKIKLDDTITFGASSYQLFAFVCHTGELGSGRFHPVMRPRGPDTPWLRWSTRGSSRGSVLPQTHRQAVTAHEGSDTAETSAAVACVAVYLRQDHLDELLILSPDRETHDVFNPLDLSKHTTTDSHAASEFTVAVHLSTGFPQHSSKDGIVDTWKSQDDSVLLLNVRKDETLYDLHERLRTQASLREKEFLLWPLDMQRDIRQYCPPLLNAHLEIGMGSLQDSMNGTHFWLHVLEGEQAEASKRQYDELMHRKAAESLASLKQSVPAPVAVEQAPQEATQDPFESDVVMGGTDDDSASSQEQIALPVAPGGVLALLTTPASPPPSSSALDAYPTRTVLNEPGFEHSSADELLVQIDGGIPPSPPATTFQEPQKHMYVMIKHFHPLKKVQSRSNPSESRLQPLVEASISQLVPQDAIIKDLVVRPVNESGKSGKEQETRFYRERPGALPVAIDGDLTFAEASLSHGSVIITEPVLSDMHVKTFTSQGYPISVAEMFSSEDLPGQNTFGTGWSACPVKFGRAHGQGTIIYANGDAYCGNFTSGKRHAKGTMFFANGSNYQGEWKDDQPNGQGTMIYAPSGNKYVGPFKDGKQTGRGGVTYWQDASVNENICRICYVDERNTVFIRCGHMVACQSCATQVSECPVCRRQIDQVIRVWDSLQ